VDVVWPDEFIKKGYMLDVTDKITQDMKDGIIPAGWLGVNRNGKTYGMPWLLDVKYFYYNTDMIKAAGFTAPPKTWEEMITQATAIKAKGLSEFPIAWSWGPFEAAIVDFTALLFGNGGAFLDASGKPVFNDPKGIEVLTWMKAGIDGKLFNPSSPTYKEADVESALLGGKAAFGMNWLSTYANSNDPTLSTVVGKIAFAPVPVFASAAATGLTSASCDGSSAFAVSATSPNKEAAWKFLVYLTSSDVQMKYSSKQLPIWKAAYEGANLTALENATTIGPVTVPAFLAQFPFANERPTVAYYNEASTALQLALQEAFSGAKSPKDALDAAAAKWNTLAGQ
jgi:multiple sugar transport system substrate-binding protein